MKKALNQNNEEHDDKMLPEYDFSKMSGGVRGKYYKAYRQDTQSRFIKLTAQLRYITSPLKMAQ